MSKAIFNGKAVMASVDDADQVRYDNTESTLSATNIQAAIDELDDEKVNTSAIGNTAALTYTVTHSW